MLHMLENFISILYFEATYYKTRWTNLRDRYNKLRNMKTKSGSGKETELTWAFFKSLSFLDDTVERRLAGKRYISIGLQLLYIVNIF